MVNLLKKIPGLFKPFILNSLIFKEFCTVGDEFCTDSF